MRPRWGTGNFVGKKKTRNPRRKGGPESRQGGKKQGRQGFLFFFCWFGDVVRGGKKKKTGWNKGRQGTFKDPPVTGGECTAEERKKPEKKKRKKNFAKRKGRGGFGEHIKINKKETD